jgi:hypothetical protein
MESNESLGAESSFEADEKDYRKPKRRGSLTNFVWPPPKPTTSRSTRSPTGPFSGLSSSLHSVDFKSPPCTSRGKVSKLTCRSLHGLSSSLHSADFMSPHSTSRGKVSKLTCPQSAGPRTSFVTPLLSGLPPSTPKSAGRPRSYSKPRTSTRLKKLWPPLEAQEAPLSSGASPQHSFASIPSSPFSSPVKKTLKSLGAGLQFTPPLEANTARRRTLKTAWPPVAPNIPSAKSKTKRCLDIVRTQPGLTKARRSISDNGKVPFGPFPLSDSQHKPASNLSDSQHKSTSAVDYDKSLSPKKPEQAEETLMNMSSSSSTFEFGSDDANDTKESNPLADAGEMTECSFSQRLRDKHAANASDSTNERHEGNQSSPQHALAADDRLQDIFLPSGQKLPRQTTRQKKRHGTNYRIRYDGPTTLNLSLNGRLMDIPEIDVPERDGRFESSQSDRSMQMPKRRNSSTMGRGRDGTDSMPSQPRRSYDDDSLSDEDALADDIVDRTLEPKSKHMPDIWIAPLANEDPSERKWMLKRVWYVEEMDEKEEEQTVDHEELVTSIQKLCGVPDVDNYNLQVTDEGSVSSPWFIQKIYDIEGEQANWEEEVVCTTDAMVKEMNIISKEADHTVRELEFESLDDSDHDNLVPPPPNLSDDDTSVASETDHFLEKEQIKGSNPKLSPASYQPTEATESRLPMIVLPRGQKLPPPKGRKKRRRTNYQIQYDGPTLLRVHDMFDIPEEDNRFQSDDVNDGAMARPARRTSGKDAMPSRPRRSYDDDYDSDEEPAAGMVDNEDSTDDHGIIEIQESKGKSYRPDVWVTPFKIEKPEDKLIWKIRRVWDEEVFNEKEEEHAVDDRELFVRVRELFGVPPELGVENPEGGSDFAPFVMKRIYDIDGEIEVIEEGTTFSLETLRIEMVFLSEEAKRAELRWQRSPIAETKNKPKPAGIAKKVNGPSVTESKEAKGGMLGRILPWRKKVISKVKQNVTVKLWWEE